MNYPGGTYRPGEREYTITIGEGKTNPYGRRQSFTIEGLLGWLYSPQREDTWFSGIRWADNHRRIKNYEGADLIALDYDWVPSHVEGGPPMPIEEQSKVLEVVQCAYTPARIAYTTPRGMRLLVMCDESPVSAREYYFFARAAQSRALEVLRREGVSELLEADPGNLEAARMMWAPNIIAGAFKREGRVIESEDGLISESPHGFMVLAHLEALEESIGAGEKASLAAQRKMASEELHRRAVESAKRAGQSIPLSIQEANDRFNASNSWAVANWPTKSQRGQCPMCGGSGFGTLNADVYKWVCHSTRHTNVNAGHAVSEVCRVGDVLDLLAHIDGKTRIEMLKSAGLLKETNGK